MINFTELVDAVDGALSVISNVTDLPGIDLIPYVATVSKVVKYAKMAAAAGKKIAPYADALTDSFKNGLPSADKLAALDARMEELHTQNQANVPVPEEGEEV